MPSRLEYSFNSNKLGEYMLDKEVLTIGRKEDNDICIENLAVSGHHAKLLTIFDDSFLEDLNSTNGTYVNGKPIGKHPLKHGDVIIIGKHELRYINDSRLAGIDDDKTILIRRPQQANVPAANLGPIAYEKPSLRPETTLTTTPNPIAGASSTASPEAADLTSATLQLLNGKSAGKELPLVKPSVKLGKAGVEVIQINRRPDGHFIVCLKLPAGCRSPRVNGEDIGSRSVRLQNHDVIEINRLKIEYFLAG